MKSFVTSVLCTLISILVIAALAKWLIPYLAMITLVDYVAYCGVVAIVIAYITYDGANFTSYDITHTSTHRDLVNYEADTRDRQHQISFSFSVGISGVLLLLVSGLMVWLT